MNLVIDRGNTHLKYGIFDKRKLVASDSINFLDKSDIKKLVDKYHLTNVILSSVVAKKNDELVSNLKEEIPTFIELSHNTLLPFSWNYKSKETIGKDRLAAIAGALELYPDTNLLVFDAGTALTYELINDKSEFVGGNISPGLQMRFKALNSFTSRLPLLTPNTDAPFLGNSTQEAIEAGVQNSMCFEIEGLIEHFKSNYNELTCIITGGDAEFFARKLKNPIFVAPNLVLIGLNRILEHNV
ncbi:type III pantothenate kinase [Carboxylicivirga linearis]|uniref:Type III pantothenate kinase n=1 Tax=Carboxylicivirga linearis TaxID=1628157 RepID=A0ABS5JZI3_9BACT|nr:type III pantothenate kinase [Carboxylicivirga linearis]MBS2100330.1 type III pantothenate kinase [Carboxylicivirga linearis]